MPIGISKDHEIWVEIDSDESIPPEHRPAMRCHFLTVREWLKVQDIEKRLLEATGEPQLRLAWEAIRVCATGWRNVTDADGKPIDIATIDPFDHFTPRQLWDIKVAVLDAITERELSLKKPSGSPAKSHGDASAPDAARASA